MRARVDVAEHTGGRRWSTVDGRDGGDASVGRNKTSSPGSMRSCLQADANGVCAGADADGVLIGRVVGREVALEWSQLGAHQEQPLSSTRAMAASELAPVSRLDAWLERVEWNW